MDKRGNKSNYIATIIDYNSLFNSDSGDKSDQGLYITYRSNIQCIAIDLKIIAPLLNPMLFKELNLTFRMYLIIVNTRRYPLIDFTLYNNYRAIHLVNNKSRLTLRTFKEAKYSDTIKARTLYILILRTGERRIESIF